MHWHNYYKCCLLQIVSPVPGKRLIAHIACTAGTATTTGICFETLFFQVVDTNLHFGLFFMIFWLLKSLKYWVVCFFPILLSSPYTVLVLLVGPLLSQLLPKGPLLTLLNHQKKKKKKKKGKIWPLPHMKVLLIIIIIIIIVESHKALVREGGSCRHVFRVAESLDFHGSQFIQLMVYA